MPKNIVLCADGTGNSGGKGFATNVWRLFNAIDLRCHESDEKVPKQIAFYDDGVGTEEFKLWRLLGGAFGWGLSRNIRELYESLARNYESGDRLYVFGFSRGAFTARSLAGFIARTGVVDLRRQLTEGQVAMLKQAAFPIRSLAFILGWLGFFRFRARPGYGYEHSARIKLLVNAAFTAYREHHKRHSRWSLTWIWFELMKRFLPKEFRIREHTDDLDNFKAQFSVDGAEADACVQCIGVWDTVGALGAPNDVLRAIIDWVFSISFHDQALHDSVRYGFQALAIDDERGTFKPVLWDESPATAERIEQVWFSGAHSNIGGGYPKQGMACVTMYWMLRRAQFSGLHFQAGEIERARAQANVHDKLYDSRAGFASYYRYKPREIAALVSRSARIHYSAFDRIASGVQDYVPENLPGEFTIAGDEVPDAMLAREATGGGAPRVAPQHDADIAARAYWQDRLERSGVMKHRSELAMHLRSARRWILARQGLYFAMLAGSLLLVMGVLGLELPGSTRPPEPSAWVKPLAVLISPLDTGLHELLIGSTERLPASLRSGAVRTLDFIATRFIPSSIEKSLRSAADYFWKHPMRFLLSLLLIGSYLQLRRALYQGTRGPFEAFWSRLRGPLPADNPPGPGTDPAPPSDAPSDRSASADRASEVCL